MKQVRIVIPANKVNVILEITKNLELETDISLENDKATLLLIVEDTQTSLLIEELKGIGVGTIFGKLAMSPIDFELSSTVKRKKIIPGKSISLDEMLSNFRSLSVLSPTFVILSISAGILAAFGLLFDNIVIVIASMIIAPFLGPIALSVIGSLFPRNTYTIRAFAAEFSGLSLCILLGFLVGLFFPLQDTIPHQIAIRTEPGIADIVFAIFSGLAAGIFIIRGESTNIVGVAVAASLCPPAANVGILLSNLLWSKALSSLFLLILNVISIYSACAIIFWLSQSLGKGGTTSSRQYSKMSKKYFLQSTFAIFVLIAIIVIIILY